MAEIVSLRSPVEEVLRYAASTHAPRRFINVCVPQRLLREWEMQRGGSRHICSA